MNHKVEVSSYALLGLPTTATEEDINKAYKKLSKLYHPDITKSEDSSMFRLLKEAKDSLTVKRPKANSNSYGFSKTSTKANSNSYGFSKTSTKANSNKERYYEKPIAYLKKVQFMYGRYYFTFNLKNITSGRALNSPSSHKTFLSIMNCEYPELMFVPRRDLIKMNFNLTFAFIDRQGEVILIKYKMKPTSFFYEKVPLYLYNIFKKITSF